MRAVAKGKKIYVRGLVRKRDIFLCVCDSGEVARPLAEWMNQMMRVPRELRKMSRVEATHADLAKFAKTLDGVGFVDNAPRGRRRE